MSLVAEKSPYAGYRFPAEVISHAVWLYFRFPLVLRTVEELRNPPPKAAWERRRSPP